MMISPIFTQQILVSSLRDEGNVFDLIQSDAFDGSEEEFNIHDKEG